MVSFFTMTSAAPILAAASILVLADVVAATTDHPFVRVIDGNLHVNSSGAGTVFINGQEQVSNLAMARRFGLLLANGTYFGSVDVRSNLDVFANAPLLEHIVELRGDLYIANTGLASLEGIAAPRLTTVTGDLGIEDNHNLATIFGTFPALTDVGGRSVVSPRHLFDALPDSDPLRALLLQTMAPTGGPATLLPTAAPTTSVPSIAPSRSPTVAPTAAPTDEPPCRWVACGRPADGCPDEPNRCAPVTEQHESRCCSDSALNGWVAADYRCTLGPNYRMWHVSSGGHSEGCQETLNYAQHVAFCRRIGGRVCTRREMVAGCVSGDGCSHDYDLVWTSDPG